MFICFRDCWNRQRNAHQIWALTLRWFCFSETCRQSNQPGRRCHRRQESTNPDRYHRIRQQMIGSRLVPFVTSSLRVHAPNNGFISPLIVAYMYLHVLSMTPLLKAKGCRLLTHFGIFMHSNATMVLAVIACSGLALARFDHSQACRLCKCTDPRIEIYSVVCFTCMTSWRVLSHAVTGPILFFHAGHAFGRRYHPLVPSFALRCFRVELPLTSLLKNMFRRWSSCWGLCSDGV